MFLYVRELLSTRPYMLLMPNYVYRKEFFTNLVGTSTTACFITPPVRYSYYRYTVHETCITGCDVGGTMPLTTKYQQRNRLYT